MLFLEANKQLDLPTLFQCQKEVTGLATQEANDPLMAKTVKIRKFGYLS